MELDNKYATVIVERFHAEYPDQEIKILDIRAFSASLAICPRKIETKPSSAVERTAEITLRQKNKADYGTL